MKLTLDIRISFSHLWSFFIVDQWAVHYSVISTSNNLPPAVSDLKVKNFASKLR
jgi:hypothetical protein